MRKSVWLLSAGLFALATPAYAQDADPAPTPPAESPTEAADVDEQDEGVIVVTAQGRTQILQDVPIAVTAVGGDQMQNSGATDIRQLNQLAPSLFVFSTGSEANGRANVRGIGTVGDNPGLESSVAVFIDGVYRSRSGIGLNELGEIDRIEVLRGPQGTLFGRNASAGLINIISKKPSFNFGGYGEATIGNYDLRRLAGGITGPLSETIAFRIDAVGAKRDGFYKDENNDTTINNRNRFFTRGQLLFEPNADLNFRLIADYTKRDEKCCAAVYVNNEINDEIGDLNNPATPINSPNGNNIINVLRDLGQDLDAFDDPFSRNVSVSEGRGYGGKTTDAGVSLEAGYDFSGMKLTSITGYRYYKASQGGDFDYSTVDILYRDDDDSSYRRFKTFSQELRLQGSAFNDKLDWLVGGYFADENLLLQDSLRFGDDYGRFATCRLVSGSPLAALYNPAAAGCLAARPAAFGLASPAIYAGIDRLDSLNDLGGDDDRYRQNSRNWALFTHNIFHLTNQIDLTVGLRYTNERKKFSATFGNDNNVCFDNQVALGPFLAVPALAGTADAIIRLSCFGNSTSELDGVRVKDKRSENKLTGTGVLSYKPTDDLLFYASYSRGYKAGGFNLDRSALKRPVGTFADAGGAQSLVGNLQFDPETNDAFELGGKFSMRGVTFNVALFRQQFKNFQLNTFDGSVFLVQNINGCTKSLDGLDRDQSKFPQATDNYTPVSAENPLGADSTGDCDKDDVGYGVRSQGVELEASFRPMRDLRLNAGLTLADTRYRKNLVGTDDGAPLSSALRELPGKRVSGAPKTVATGALSYTPAIGGRGLSGLFYVDARYSAGFNSGSDLFPQKSQDDFTVVNGRIGVRGPDERWAVELWAQNLFDKDYSQVAFNSPFQEGAASAPFTDPNYPGGRQIFSAYVAEPRTYGLTVRARFAGPRPMPVVEAAPPPPPPPPATQTCPDGSVILATDTCPPVPEPYVPPAPPPAEPERG